MVFDGNIPAGSIIETGLALALKECITNTLRHAKRTVLTVTIKEGIDTVEAEFADNGTPPDSEITLGGGLSGLKERLMMIGATMEVVSTPKFTLVIRIPKVAKEESI